MSVKTDFVMAGFIHLSFQEQLEVIDQICKYLNEDSAGKRSLKESFEKRAGLDLGPLNLGGCPCCGR